MRIYVYFLLWCSRSRVGFCKQYSLNGKKNFVWPTATQILELIVLSRKSKKKTASIQHAHRTEALQYAKNSECAQDSKHVRSSQMVSSRALWLHFFHASGKPSQGSCLCWTQDHSALGALDDLLDAYWSGLGARDSQSQVKNFSSKCYTSHQQVPETMARQFD